MFLGLFNTVDPRERDYLKTTLHRTYGKSTARRRFICKSMCETFQDFVNGTFHHNGISELLEILGSIANGFAVPLKEEHKHTLTDFLVPLHKMSTVDVYAPQLRYILECYVEKDPTLAGAVVDALARLDAISLGGSE